MITTTKSARKYLKRENEKWPWHLEDIPREQWPASKISSRIRLMRSRDFLVQVFDLGKGIVRLSINRTDLNGAGRFTDSITWDELQQLKFQCGYGDRDAVEVYPAQKDVVNVANMRHLFVYVDAPSPEFIWRNREESQ